MHRFVATPSKQSAPALLSPKSRPRNYRHFLKGRRKRFYPAPHYKDTTYLPVESLLLPSLASSKLVKNHKGGRKPKGHRRAQYYKQNRQDVTYPQKKRLSAQQMSVKLLRTETYRLRDELKAERSGMESERLRL